MSYENTPIGKLDFTIQQCNKYLGCDVHCTALEQEKCFKLKLREEIAKHCKEQNIDID